MKLILKFFLGLVLILTISFFVLRTPDTDPKVMQTKYGGSIAQTAFQNGLSVHFRDQGNPEGSPILFIHGSNASLHTWERVIGNLGNDYRLISLDLPGHGLTGAHPYDDYSIDGMFDAVDAVVDTLDLSGQQLALVGNSMGGWVSWRYALAYPERVSALVLIDAAGAPTDEAPPLNLGFRLLQNGLARELAKSITPRWLVKKSLQQSVYDGSKITEADVDRYWELIRYPGNRHATSIRASLSRDEKKYGERINELNVPTLILWGEADQLVYVSDAHYFADKIDNSNLVVYPDIGHIPMEENPVGVARDILEFMKTRSEN